MRPITLTVFHDSSGKVDALGSLVGHLPANVQVFGLERRHGTTRFQTVSDLAAEHLKCLRAAQATGPWYLAGWSFGGNLAYEVARQIEAGGQEVELLLLIDSEPPCCNDWGDLYHQSLKAIDEFGLSNEKLGFEGEAMAVAALDVPCELIAAKLPSSIRDAIPSAECGNPNRYSRALGAVLDHVRLLASYQPAGPVHPARTICIGASQSGQAMVNGWAAWIHSPIMYQVIVGDHRSILRTPAVEQIAKTVNSALFGLN